MKIDELMRALSVIREEQGNCDVFASLGNGSSQFLVEGAEFVDRKENSRSVPPHQQEWIPSRVVLRLRSV